MNETLDQADERRYRAFLESGFPVCFLGVDYRTKAELDAAIDALAAQEVQPPSAEAAVYIKAQNEDGHPEPIPPMREGELIEEIDSLLNGCARHHAGDGYHKDRIAKARAALTAPVRQPDISDEQIKRALFDAGVVQHTMAIIGAFRAALHQSEVGKP